MKHRGKLYSIPVLGKGSDSYKTSTFTTEIEAKRDMHKLVIQFKTQLCNPELEELVKQEKVVFACHVECPQTCYREIFETFDAEATFPVDEVLLNGAVDISSFLVAKEKIDNFVSKDFSEDYQGLSFELHPGLFLGIGSFTSLKYEKSEDDFADNPSIFSIVMDKNPNHTEARIETSNERIRIILPERTYHHYCALSHHPQYMEILHSTLLVPALMKVLTDLKEQNANGAAESVDTESHWYLCLDRAYKKYGSSIADVINRNCDPFIEAQHLLNSPITKGFEKLMIGDEADED